MVLGILFWVSQDQSIQDERQAITDLEDIVQSTHPFKVVPEHSIQDEKQAIKDLEDIVQRTQLIAHV